jgi:hypothetical protein
MLIKLGNFLEEIKHNYENPNCKLNMGGHGASWVKTNLIYFFENELSKVIPFNRIQETSWITNDLTLELGSPVWHKDVMPMSGMNAQIIGAYPFGTQFLETEDENIKDIRWHAPWAEAEEKAQLVENSIRAGKSKIIEIEPGDLYLTSTDSIHRSNPKSMRNKHLCVRYNIL